MDSGEGADKGTACMMTQGLVLDHKGDGGMVDAVSDLHCCFQAGFLTNWDPYCCTAFLFLAFSQGLSLSQGLLVFPSPYSLSPVLGSGASPVLSLLVASLTNGELRRGVRSV